MKTDKREHYRPGRMGKDGGSQDRHPGKDRFDNAVRLHLGGDLDAALAAYDEVLAYWPGYAEAQHNAGVIRAQRGQLDAATGHFRRAVELNGRYAEAHHSLGLALNMAGERRDAIAAFRRATELNPASIDWWTDLGTLLTAEGRFIEGLEASDRALALDPRNPQSLANRAAPLRGLHRHQDAADACRASLALRPESADTHVNLGMVLRESGDLDGARAAFDRALAISSRHLKARANIAALLQQQRRHDEARAIAEDIITEQPDSTEGWTLLGTCALEAAEFGLAEQCQREALARAPANASAQWNLAQLLLLRGDYVEGFRHFESRKRLEIFARHNHDAPEWNGEPLGGRTILVHAEQGFGDSIQFVRLLPLLKERGAGRVILDQCPPEVASLLRGAPGVDQLVVRGERSPAFDVHAYLMSLPFLMGITLDTLPDAVPYLRAPDRPVARAIRERGGAGVRVGLVWAGNKFQTRDRVRSVGLAALAPLLAVPGAAFFSLQKGEGLRELDASPHAPIVNLDPVLGDFSDTAAAIDALDLVITVDTSVAHLAGALGKEVWTLHAQVPDWRWMLDRGDSPWYPTMRLFRQSALNDWSAPVAAAAHALAGFVSQCASEPGTAVPARPVAPATVIAEATTARIRGRDRLADRAHVGLGHVRAAAGARARPVTARRARARGGAGVMGGEPTRSAPGAGDAARRAVTIHRAGDPPDGAGQRHARREHHRASRQTAPRGRRVLRGHGVRRRREGTRVLLRAHRRRIELERRDAQGVRRAARSPRAAGHRPVDLPSGAAYGIDGR